MTKKRNKFELFIQVICGILVFASICSVASYIYFKTLGKGYVPSAITSSYITSVYDPQTKENKQFMEVNVYDYSNRGDDQNSEKAVAIVELKINSYSGSSKQAIYSKGYQMLVADFLDDKAFSGAMAYDSYDGVSFVAAKQLDKDAIDNNTYIADIDGTTYGIRLDGTYKAVERKWIFFKKEVTKTYTMNSFMQYLYYMAVSCSNGTGDSIIPLADLGNYFSLYQEIDGQFKEKVSLNTENNAYFTIKLHYDKRGMTSYKQSLFKSVWGDNSFNLTGLPEGVDYWKDTTTKQLNNSSFINRIDNDKVYISLDLELVQKLSNLKNIEIEITLNVENITGLDYYGLCGLKIKKLTLISDKQVDFELLNASLKDTGLTISEISTTNVNIVNLEVM